MPAATITSTVHVDRPPAVVHDLLDDLSAHEAFTDHYITDWALSGPRRGVGGVAEVKVKGGRSRIEVVSSTPQRIAEQGVGGPRGRWRTTGVYDLAAEGDGTRVTFTNTMDAPTAPERALARLALRSVRRDNDRALERLRELLEAAQPAAATSS